METYYLFANEELVTVITAQGPCRALSFAQQWIRNTYGPNKGFVTRWIFARLEAESGALVDSWTESFDPAPPECTPASPELGTATVGELQLLWRAPVYDEDGHYWAIPPDLVGELPDYPRVLPFVCLRCGSSWTRSMNVTHIDSGRQGLESITVEPGRYAAEVRDAWRAAHPESLT